MEKYLPFTEYLYCIENSRIITVKNNETICCEENESDRLLIVK